VTIRRELEIILLARHAGDDASDAGPAAEPLVESGDQRRLVAGRVTEAERLSIVKRM